MVFDWCLVTDNHSVRCNMAMVEVSIWESVSEVLEDLDIEHYI